MKDFIFLHRTEFIVLILICAFILNLLLRIKWVTNTINTIIDDTLKVYDPESKTRRFSGTKLTMLTAFTSVLWAFHYITIKFGFNETGFITMACIATGVGVTKALSKKLDPTVVSPDSQTTVKQDITDTSSKTIIKEETIQ